MDLDKRPATGPIIEEIARKALARLKDRALLVPDRDSTILAILEDHLEDAFDEGNSSGMGY
jgi:hypothetical protein